MRLKLKLTGKVDARPSIQWYPGDALGDVGLRITSLQAKGLWYEMLWFMFYSPERGVLLKQNGSKLDDDDLANLFGVEVHTIEECLSELEENGVFTRRDDGAIYNRRMVRDESNRRQHEEREKELSKKRAEAGRKGGLASKVKAKEGQIKGSSTSTPTPTPSPRESSKPKTKKLFPEDQKPKKVRPGSNIPPTPEEVTEYAKGRDFELDGHRFCDYYEARGWKLSNGRKMVNWQAAVRTWQGNNQQKGSQYPPWEKGMIRASDLESETEEEKAERLRKVDEHNQQVRERLKAKKASRGVQG